MARPDVLVLGGGIVGLATARELARSGLRVEVLERGQAGRGTSASWASAGMLAPLFENGTGPALERRREARDLWREWALELMETSRHGIDWDTTGALAVDASGSPWLRELRRTALEAGEDAEPVEEKELRRWIPDLGDDPVDALALPGQHRVDNRKVLLALASVLREERLPVHEGHEVLQVDVRDEEVVVRGKSFTRSANWILVAAGEACGSIPGLPELPVRPVRGQLVALDDVEWVWRGAVWWGGGGSYAVARGRDRLLAGSTLEEGDLVARPTVAGVASILGRVAERFPGLGDRPLHSTWAGLRPATPDGLPILGPDPRSPRVWWATGHHTNGILLAPWTARRIAAAVAEGLPLPPELAAGRFESGTTPPRS